jgi:hypothetical protein
MKINLQSKFILNFRSIIFPFIKVATVFVLLTLGWFASQGALFDFIVPRLHLCFNSNRIPDSSLTNTNQGLPLLDKLIPSAKGLDINALKSAFDKIAHSNPRELSESLFGEQNRQLSEMGMAISSQNNEEDSHPAEVFMPLENHETNLDKIQTRLHKIQALINKASDYFSNYEANIFWGCLYSTVIWLVILCILFAARWKTAVRILTSIMFVVSGTCLKILSILLTLIFYSLGTNPWQYALGVFFWLPACLLITNAASYYILEKKFTLWKKLYIYLSYPIFSGAIIYLKHFFPL